MPRANRPTLCAAFAALLLFAALAAFGAAFHSVEETGSAERDGFVAQAERVLRGELPDDPFRPPAYPCVIAAVSRLVGGGGREAPFVAARLLSNLAAAALAWSAFAITRRLAGPERAALAGEHAFGRRLAGGESGVLAGALAFALVAANSATWIDGQHVTTDMPFAALAAAALLASHAYLERPGLAAALGAGLAFGGAACIRGNALLLLPGLLAAWWLGRRRAPGPRRTVELLLAAVCATALLVPNWILRERAFGDAFHDENWKNLAFKLHGWPDWTRFPSSSERGSFLQILASEPVAVARGMGDELLRLARSGISDLLGSRMHALAALAGAWLCMRRRVRGTGWLLASLALFTAGVAAAFFAWGRFLVVALPVVAATTAVGALSAAKSARTRCVAIGAVIALIGWLGAKAVIWRLPWFVANHPSAEVAALRRLDAELAPGAALAGTSPFLGRYLVHDYFEIEDASGAPALDAEAYAKRLVATLRERRAAWLVVGAQALLDRPRALLGTGPPPAGLELVETNAAFTTWRVLPGS
jgi:4-amino-4-deoxy-L-arabinose transferase-like glycosyltransferase